MAASKYASTAPIDKNLVAERAVQELGSEFLNISLEGGPISTVTLALATENLNARIRHSGLSSREIWTQHDQLIGEQLPLTDSDLIMDQHTTRKANHSPSAKSKARGRTPQAQPHLQVGSLILSKSDGDKTRARERYLVTDMDPEYCHIRKFTKAKFHSKLYKVKTGACHVIQPNLPNQQHDPICGLTPPSDSDSDDHVTYPAEASGISHHDTQPEAPDLQIPPAVCVIFVICIHRTYLTCYTTV